MARTCCLCHLLPGVSGIIHVYADVCLLEECSHEGVLFTAIDE